VIMDTIKVAVAAAVITCLVLAGTNVAIQRHVCRQQWGDIDPFRVQRCEPVGLIESQIDEYRRLANDQR